MNIFKRLKERLWMKELNKQFINNALQLEQLITTYTDRCEYIERRNELEGELDTYTQTRQAVFTEKQLSDLKDFGLDTSALVVNSLLADIGQSIIKDINKLLRTGRPGDLFGFRSENAFVLSDIVQMTDVAMINREMYLIGNFYIGTLLQLALAKKVEQKAKDWASSTYNIGYVNYKKSEEELVPMHIYVDPYISRDDLTFSIISEKVRLYTPKNIIKSIKIHKENDLYVLIIEYAYIVSMPTNVCNIKLHMDETGEL